MDRRFRDLLVDGHSSLGARFRSNRWNVVCQSFPNIDQMRILDLGGTLHFWMRTPVTPAAVDVLNPTHDSEDVPTWLRLIEGDACNPPEAIRRERYDLVFSNSVIEHVGGHWRRRQFAETVQTLADSHWVQTPYRYFPLEPHYLGPAFQFLPVGARARLLTVWPLMHTRPQTWRQAMSTVFATELIGRAELSYLFPDSRIYSEKVAGITKSLTAVRTFGRS